MTEPKQYTDAELIAVIRLAMNNWEKVYGRNVWKQWTYEDADFERETGSWDKPSTRDRVERMFFGIMMGESYRDTFEAALLYGLAYMNEYNNMHMTQWLDEVKLPKIEDVDKFIKVG